MTRDENSKEFRIAKRQKVLKTGKILLAGNLSVIDCTIRDLSATGARLLVGDQAAVPATFRLVVLMDNSLREAKSVWRRGNEIGVTFSGEAKRAPPRRW